jgi:hypothetical protein
MIKRTEQSCYCCGITCQSYYYVITNGIVCLVNYQEAFFYRKKVLYPGNWVFMLHDFEL